MELNLSEIQIRYKRITNDYNPCIDDARKVYELMKHIEEFQFNMDYKEMAYAIYLDCNCNIIGVHKLSEGSVNHCSMDTRIVFQGAILSNAKAFILVHNHPSRSLEFSKQDKATYCNFKKAGDIMCINLLDFLVITADGFKSINHSVINE